MWAYEVIDDRCGTCYGAQPHGADEMDEAGVQVVEHEADGPDAGDVLDEQAEAIRG